MNVYYLTPEMRTPPVIRTLELVPGVSVIEGFHCTCFCCFLGGGERYEWCLDGVVVWDR